MKHLPLFFACLFTLTVSAQEKLVIQGKIPNQYVVHIASSGESLQIISNQFGQSVSKLSNYNRKSVSSILKVGEKIKIPITEYNTLKVKGSGNNAPLYHITKKGDNLFRISKVYKVTIASLRNWNNLKGEAVKNGQFIIVGFMVNAKNSAELVKVGKVQPSVSSPETENAEIKLKNEVSNIATKASSSVSTEKSAQTMQQISMTPVNNELSKFPAIPIRKSATVSNYIPIEGDEGFFAESYSEKEKNLTKQFQSGDASIFKSISGWADHKYYILMDDVAPETVVRITGISKKSICAKVLGPLQETKTGSGLLLRMSNSAASALGQAEIKFTVTVTYFE